MSGTLVEKILGERIAELEAKNEQLREDNELLRDQINQMADEYEQLRDECDSRAEIQTVKPSER